MAKTIFKYRLNIGVITTVKAASTAQPIHVGEQNGEVVLWMLVDDAAPQVEHRFEVFGTGWSFDDDGLNYVGSVQMQSSFVWHVFQEASE